MINDILAHSDRERVPSPRGPAARPTSLGARGVAALVAGTFMLAMTAPAIADDDDDDRWKRRGEASQIHSVPRYGKGIVVCEDDDDDDDDCFYVRRGVPRSWDRDDDDRRDD